MFQLANKPYRVAACKNKNLNYLEHFYANLPSFAPHPTPLPPYPPTRYPPTPPPLTGGSRSGGPPPQAPQKLLLGQQSPKKSPFEGRVPPI